MTQASQSRVRTATSTRVVVLGAALGGAAAFAGAPAAADPVVPIAVEASATSTAPAATTTTSRATAAHAAPSSSPSPSAAPSAAPAPSAARPIVVDTQSLESMMDPALVREAIARELGRPILAAGSPEAGDVGEQLVVRPFSNGRVLVTFRDRSGRALQRTLRVTADPSAASRTIALLAGNLARNEAHDLATALGTSAAMRNASGPRAGGSGRTTLELPEMDITGDAAASGAAPADPASVPPTAQPRPAGPRAPLDDESPTASTGGPLRDRPTTLSRGETYEQRHGGRIAVMAAAGIGVAAGTLMFPVTAGAQYRWRRVAVGLDVTYAAFTQQPSSSGFSLAPGFRPAIAEPQTRVAISPMFWTNFSGGPFRIELGAGIGLMTLDGLARDTGGMGLVLPTLSVNVTARAAATIVWAMTRFLDLMLINDAVFGLASLNPPGYGFAPRVAEPQFATNLALQWRFWR